jgi:hypothetical protein
LNNCLIRGNQLLFSKMKGLQRQQLASVCHHVRLQDQRKWAACFYQ